MPHAPIVFLDVETGGRDPAVHPLLTIGLVTLNQAGELLRPLHLRLRHDQYVTEPEALAVTGIDLEAHHAQAQPQGEVVAALRDYAEASARETGVEKTLLAGHNFGFDLSFVRPLYPELFRSFRRGPLDTKVIAQFLIQSGALPRRVGTALDGLAGHFGVVYGAHDALEDARATARVYLGLEGLVRAAGVRLTP